MDCFRLAKNFFEDIWRKLCDNKWKTLVCTVVAVVGVAVGIALFQAFKYGWWYCNRCNFADKLFDGSFALIFLFAGCYAIFYLCIVFSNLIPQTRFLCYVALFVACLYCGATAAAVIACYAVWGVVYVIVVTIVEVSSYFVACLVACCEWPSCRTVNEAFCDFSQTLQVLCVAFVAKLLGFFVILQLITAVI